MGAAFSSSLGLHSLIMGVAIKEQHTQQELRQPQDQKKNSTAVRERKKVGQKCWRKMQKSGEKAGRGKVENHGNVRLLQPEQTMVKLNSASAHSKCSAAFLLQFLGHLQMTSSTKLTLLGSIKSVLLGDLPPRKQPVCHSDKMDGRTK